MKAWLIIHKKKLTALLLVLVLVAGIWQIVSARLGEAVQATLIARAGEAVNGRLAIGKVDLSLAGRIRIRDVALYDREDKLLLQSPLVKISYSWSNLRNGSLGLPQIERVLLEEAEFFVKQQGAVSNWSNVLKEEEKSKAEVTGFHGKVELENGRLHLDTALGARTLSAINGSLDWQQAPVVALQAAGLIGQSLFTASGTWKGEITIQAAALDLTEFRDLLVVEGTQLEAGQIRNLAVLVSQDEKGTLSYRAEGELAEIKTAGAAELEAGQGTFHLDANGVNFSGLSGLISGQQVSGQGAILWQNAQSKLDFTLTLPDVDAGAFISDLSAVRPLAIAAQVTGSTAAPLISGSFTVPQVSFGGLAVDGVRGNFRYAGSRLILDQAQGSIYQGGLSASGQVDIVSRHYEMAIAGQGMDSSRLTDKDVSGPLDFTGTVSGRGEAAVAKGSFKIRNGKAYGLSFQALTGAFVRQGTATEISNIAVHTALGTFYPEQLSQEALAKLQEKDVPVSKSELKEAVKDKLLEKLFR